VLHGEPRGGGATGIRVEDGGGEGPIVESDDRSADAIEVAHVGGREQSADQAMKPLALPAQHGARGMRGVGQLTGGVEERTPAEVPTSDEIPQHGEEPEQAGPPIGRRDALLDTSPPLPGLALEIPRD
jgi:hypothetical protein